MKKNILSKILYAILAIIILVVGYLIGTIILVTIFVVILLMSFLFVVSWIFNLLMGFFKTKSAKLAIKVVFSSFVTGVVVFIGWWLTSKWLLTLDGFLSLSIVWVTTTLLFGSLWNILKTKKTSKQYLWEYYKIDNRLSLKDFIIMIFVPTIITFIFNLFIGLV